MHCGMINRRHRIDLVCTFCLASRPIMGGAVSEPIRTPKIKRVDDISLDNEAWNNHKIYTQSHFIIAQVGVVPIRHNSASKR